jgi:hypothetical protein
MSENSAGRRGGDGQARRKERMLRANKKPGDTYFRECFHCHPRRNFTGHSFNVRERALGVRLCQSTQFSRLELEWVRSPR